MSATFQEPDMVTAAERATLRRLAAQPSFDADVIRFKAEYIETAKEGDIGDFLPLSAMQAAFQIGDFSLMGEVLFKARDVWATSCALYRANGFVMPANAPDSDDECMALVALRVAQRAGVL